MGERKDYDNNIIYEIFVLGVSTVLYTFVFPRLFLFPRDLLRKLLVLDWLGWDGRGVRRKKFINGYMHSERI